MNLKKSAVSLAVASALAAPMAMADGVSLYGRINNALDYRDIDNPAPNVDADFDLRNVSSRLGVRASADLGNGLTAHGRYEFSTFTDREGQNGGGNGGINDTRIGTVGLSGGFGRIDAGNQWSAFYNTVGTHLSPTYTLGYFLYSSVIGGPFRASNTIKYSNSAGPVSFEIDTRFAREGGTNNTEKLGQDQGEDFLDGFGIGGSWAITPMFKIAAAYDSEMRDIGDNTDRIGVAGRVDWGNFYGAVGYQMTDNGNGGTVGGPTTEASQIQLWVGGALGANTSWNLGYGMGTLESSVAGSMDVEPTQINAGLYHKIGGGPLRAWGELVLFDADQIGAAPTAGLPNGGFDFTQLVAGLRYDF